MVFTQWLRHSGVLVMLGLVAVSSGCQSGEPLVPREVYQQVNDDGREHTYDTAWQNIRMLNAELGTGNYRAIADDSLFIASQMERLELGEAGAQGSKAVAAITEEIAGATRERSSGDNVRAITAAALELQNQFDAGVFDRARFLALEVHVIALHLSETP